MITLLGLILFLIFMTLSLFHFYWGFGGRIGYGSVIPTRMDGKVLFKPGYLSTFIVAAGLLGMAIFILAIIKVIIFPLPAWILKYGLIGISMIFILRAIGDFKYIGFFARSNTDQPSNGSSNFSVMDKKYYSPLCLLIGFLAILIFVLQ